MYTSTSNAPTVPLRRFPSESGEQPRAQLHEKSPENTILEHASGIHETTFFRRLFSDE